MKDGNYDHPQPPQSRASVCPSNGCSDSCRLPWPVAALCSLLCTLISAGGTGQALPAASHEAVWKRNECFLISVKTFSTLRTSLCDFEEVGALRPGNCHQVFHKDSLPPGLRPSHLPERGPAGHLPSCLPLSPVIYILCSCPHNFASSTAGQDQSPSLLQHLSSLLRSPVYRLPCYLSGGLQ